MAQNPAHQIAAGQLLTHMAAICERSGEYINAKLDPQITDMPRLNLTLKSGEVVPLDTYVDDSDGELCYSFLELSDKEQSASIDRHFRQAYYDAHRGGVTLSFREPEPPTNIARRSKKRPHETAAN